MCDTSSDFISRPIDVSKYGLIYAGAQKNAGPAGVVVTIIREDMLERVPANLPVMLDYKAQVAGDSLHNTPPCFAIYMVGLVFKWALSLGGLAEVQRRNEAKAELVYQAIDASGGFYKGHAAAEARSNMNITFRLPSEELEDTFAKEAKKQNMIGLKGHRSVGGMRASTTTPCRSNRRRPWSSSCRNSSARMVRRWQRVVVGSTPAEGNDCSRSRWSVERIARAVAERAHVNLTRARCYSSCLP